jgi:carbon-monoxide dehydrogenase iron sulfur subunit
MKHIIVNEDVCMGCGLCKVHCLTEHSQSKDIIRAHQKETPRAIPRLRVEKIDEISLAIQCQHCDEPWCVYSCLTGAMQKNPVTGIVNSNPDKCIGCWTCFLACPYGALKRDTSRNVVTKCDLCPSLDVPACVSNCPNEALSILVDENKEG